MYKIMLPHIQCLAADKPIGKKKHYFIITQHLNTNKLTEILILSF